ncbi:MAG TPA: hypothetical protein VE861_03570 [Gemmatimonadaceae bacterium]|nr:hypothetical protein [Gemmatimonadaceae bacterium]
MPGTVRILRHSVAGPYVKAGTPARRVARLRSQWQSYFPNALLVAQVAEDRGLTADAEAIRAAVATYSTARHQYVPGWTDPSEHDHVHAAWVALIWRVRQVCAVLLGVSA